MVTIFFVTSGSLWNCYRDKVNDSANEIDNNDNMINNKKTIPIESFVYKKKIIGSTSNNNGKWKAEVLDPLKYLSNFWRSLDFPLINCEIELDLKWSKYCEISQVSRTFRAVDANANPV